MTKPAQNVLAQAMSLDPDERLALAETLLESAVISSDPGYTASWETEIDRRINEYERGNVGALAWTAVRKQLTEDAGNA